MQNQTRYYIIGAVIIIICSFVFTQPTNTKLTIPEPVSSESELNVSQSTNSEIYVQVAGAVSKPGLYQMQAGDRVNDLLNQAGGSEYNQDCINLAQKLVDEQNLYVTPSGEQCVELNAISEDGIVNVNTASSSELQTLSGIGSSYSSAIIEYREQNGTFESKSELTEVEGISDGLLESIEANIKLS